MNSEVKDTNHYFIFSFLASIHCGELFFHITVEALINGHPWDAKKVSVTGAGYLQQ